jgi:stage II sporulation protein E
MPPSWLWRQGSLERLNGDGLPLGILDEVDESDTALKLCPGDALVLLSDGVEDAFADTAALEAAVTAALTCDTPAEAAQQLLDAALAADDDCRGDDQSALVVFVRRTERPEYS